MKYILCIWVIGVIIGGVAANSLEKINANRRIALKSGIRNLVESQINTAFSKNNVLPNFGSNDPPNIAIAKMFDANPSLYNVGLDSIDFNYPDYSFYSAPTIKTKSIVPPIITSSSKISTMTYSAPKSPPIPVSVTPTKITNNKVQGQQNSVKGSSNTVIGNKNSVAGSVNAVIGNKSIVKGNLNNVQNKDINISELY